MLSRATAIYAVALQLAFANVDIPVIPYKRDPCPSGQFFDAGLLACNPCPQVFTHENLK